MLCRNYIHAGALTFVLCKVLNLALSGRLLRREKEAGSNQSMYGPGRLPVLSAVVSSVTTPDLFLREKQERSSIR